MIELNCTHEESKKILELGYDFRKISTDFVTKSGRGKLKRVNDILAVDAGIKIADINQCPHDLPDFFYFVESENLIPIIPKAALEDCLPEVLDVTDFYGELNRSRFVKRLCNGMIGLKSQDSDNFFHIWFISAFKAFTWCHEHYPEELKRKFDEVMG